MTKRHPTLPTATAIDTFAAAFDSLFTRVSQRQSFRHYLMGLLLPLETNTHLRGLARALPDTDSEALQHFLVDAPWSLSDLNLTRVASLQQHPATQWHRRGVLIIDETGDRKKGTCSDYVARQYLGRIGNIDTGVVCVTSHWADAQTHYPLDVLPYIPAGRLAQGKADPECATKPHLARQLVERARVAHVQFGAVVGDSFYGENSEFVGWLHTEHIPYVLALKPSHAIWQFVPDWNDPPPFSPLEAAARVSRAKWQVIERVMANGEQTTWYAVDLEWGHYGVEHTT